MHSESFLAAATSLSLQVLITISHCVCFLGNERVFHLRSDNLVADQRPSDHGILNHLEKNVSRNSIPGLASQ